MVLRLVAGARWAVRGRPLRASPHMACAYCSAAGAGPAKKHSVLFFGTDEFAAIILRALIDNLRTATSSPISHLELVW